MEFWDVIRARRAIRDFTGQAVLPTVISRLVDAAIQAPSALNRQPWHFTIIRDTALLDRISSASKDHVLAHWDPTHALASLREHLNDPAFHIFYHAPVLVLISAPAADAWAAEEAAMAAQNLMLAAQAEGLGSCWIGFAQQWLQTREGRQAVQLPEQFVPIAPIIIGYPRAKGPQVLRNPPKIHWIG